MSFSDVFFANWQWIHLLLIPGLIIGFTIHELGHAFMAYFLGDSTQVKEKRISANIFRHISWLGTSLFLLFGVGWPKALTFDASNFKNRYLDTFLVASAGPAANFLTSAIIFSMSFLLLGILSLFGALAPGQFGQIMFFSQTSPLAEQDFSLAMSRAIIWVIALTNRVWLVSFVLGLVSLIPLPPFDGFTMVMSLAGLLRERRLQALDIDPTELENAPPNPAETPPEEAVNPAALEKRKSIAQIHFDVGIRYHQEQQFDDAIARYRQALKADAGFGPAYVNLGLIYKARNQRNEAIHALRGATRHATDEKSRTQAWAELHTLSSLENDTATAPPHPNQTEAPAPKPWTDTHPTPDWLMLTLGLVSFVIMFTIALMVFLITLVRHNML